MEEAARPLPQAAPVAPVAAPPAAQPGEVARVLTPEEKELMDAMGRLFTAAQEFGLALASMETDVSKLPPDVKEVIEMGREVAKAVKHFQRLIRKRLGTV